MFYEELISSLCGVSSETGGKLGEIVPLGTLPLKAINGPVGS